MLARLGFKRVVPRLSVRTDAWQHDTEVKKRRSEIERLFGRIKCLRRVFTRCDKPDIIFSAFITVTLITDRLR